MAGFEIPDDSKRIANSTSAECAVGQPLCPPSPPSRLFPVLIFREIPETKGKGGLVNADDLRRMKPQATEEDRLRWDNEYVKRQSALDDARWRVARLAVQNMERLLQSAAKSGARSAVVYEETEGFLGARWEDKKSRWPWSTPESVITFEPPPFAQYVFDNCPDGVERKWDVHPGHRGTPQTGPFNGWIKLVVSW